MITDLSDIKECSRDHDGQCDGELILRTSRSGLTRSWICEHHLRELDERLDAIEQRYPEIHHPEHCGCRGCNGDDW